MIQPDLHGSVSGRGIQTLVQHPALQGHVELGAIELLDVGILEADLARLELHRRSLLAGGNVKRA